MSLVLKRNSLVCACQKTPLVSVLMSVHNTKLSQVRSSIKSILMQSESNLELILINDGSDAETTACLEEFAGDDARINLIHLLVNIGLTKALNVGIKSCTGSFIVRQDADDLSHPDRVQRQVTFLQNNPEVSAVCCNAGIINDAGERVGNTSIVFSKKMLLRKNPLVHGAMAFRRELFEEIGGYDETFKFAQDYELFLRMVVKYGLRITVLEEQLYSLRQHVKSLSHQHKLGQLYYATMAKVSVAPMKNVKSYRLFVMKTFLFDLVFIHRLFIFSFLKDCFFLRRRLIRK